MFKISNKFIVINNKLFMYNFVYCTIGNIALIYNKYTQQQKIFKTLIGEGFGCANVFTYLNVNYLFEHNLAPPPKFNQIFSL